MNTAAQIAKNKSAKYSKFCMEHQKINQL